MNYSLICIEKDYQSYQQESLSELKPGFLLLEIQQATICGSDYMVLHGNHPYKQYPAILGHEFIGRVTNTNNISRFKDQQLVTALSYGYCGNCELCQIKRYNHCLKKITYNTAGSGGAFSKHMVVHHSSLVSLPDDSDSHLFVLAEPLSIVIHAVNKVSIIPTTKILIIGAGAMGQLSAIVCQETYGACDIVFVEKNPTRRDFVAGLGFTTIDEYAALTKNHFDIMIVAGGSQLNFSQILRLMAIGSTILLISYFDTISQFDMNIIVRKELKISGSFLSIPDDLHKAVDILNNATAKRSKLEKIITTKIHFNKLKDYMLTGYSNGKVLIESIGHLE
ncbi:zinc-dependent alcohol dehydrogenase [Xenorhabdus thuongxuanensis]|uniref:Zinc-containing alcohol dehydrogenase n=1 Tax=Xenorhabdus thuongxuanensis TaxID=1873484 RepID=A0A1Q5U5R5_9GAMM|nr:alcohol dehydrogenase catalytic domain-containing protein [Xenorhabdus thuongxuanensis]OKP07822.1 zinc-containing alcohol dehydrogenase [Xenorhabdus thuongxuanensis]